MQYQSTNKFLLDEIKKHKHKNNRTKLWCKIVLQTNVEYTKGNEGFYLYLYAFGDLAQINFNGDSMCPLTKETF